MRYQVQERRAHVEDVFPGDARFAGFRLSVRRVERRQVKDVWKRTRINRAEGVCEPEYNIEYAKQCTVGWDGLTVGMVDAMLDTPGAIKFYGDDDVLLGADAPVKFDRDLLEHLSYHSRRFDRAWARVLRVELGADDEDEVESERDDRKNG